MDVGIGLSRLQALKDRQRAAQHESLTKVQGLLASGDPLHQQAAQDHLLQQTRPDLYAQLMQAPHNATPMHRLRMLAEAGLIDDAEAYARLHGLDPAGWAANSVGQQQMQAAQNPGGQAPAPVAQAPQGPAPVPQGPGVMDVMQRGLQTLAGNRDASMPDRLWRHVPQPMRYRRD